MRTMRHGCLFEAKSVPSEPFSAFRHRPQYLLAQLPCRMFHQRINLSIREPISRAGPPDESNPRDLLSSAMYPMAVTAGISSSRVAIFLAKLLFVKFPQANTFLYQYPWQKVSPAP